MFTSNLILAQIRANGVGRIGFSTKPFMHNACALHNNVLIMF